MNKKYLVDTNILSYLGDTNSPFHKKTLENFCSIDENDEVFMSILTDYELAYSLSMLEESSLLKSRILNFRKKLQSLIKVVNLSSEGADIFGEIKAKLRTKKNITRKKINNQNVDLLIASTALENEMIMISNDDIFKDLSELVPGFSYQNWAE